MYTCAAVIGPIPYCWSSWGATAVTPRLSYRGVGATLPVEGINDLLQVLRRVAHGFTNPDNYAARGILVTSPTHRQKRPIQRNRAGQRFIWYNT